MLISKAETVLFIPDKSGAYFVKKRLVQWSNQINTNISTVFIALKCKDTPFAVKLLAFITVGYALSPIDLIPDFIPVLGYLDDMIVLPILISITIKLMPKSVFERCKKEASDLWKDGKPKRWYFAIPIVLIWALIIYLIVKRFL